MWPRSARVERPFPTLSIPCGCEAYPRDLLVDCVWFKRALTLVSEKRWHHNCHRLWWHCGCRFPFSRTLFPSSCDVFSWLLSSFVSSLVCAFFLSRFVHNIMTLYGITHHCSVVVWVSWHHFSPHNTVYESHMQSFVQLCNTTNTCSCLDWARFFGFDVYFLSLFLICERNVAPRWSPRGGTLYVYTKWNHHEPRRK